MTFHPRKPSLSRRAAAAALLLVGSALLTSDLAGSVLGPDRGLSAGLESLWSGGDTLPKETPLLPVADFVAAAGPSVFSIVEPAAYLRDLPFGPEITAVAARHRVDSLLLASIIEAESSFRPDAVSDKGARGLMQLMPHHLEGGIEGFDPTANLEIGTGYLETLLARFDGDLALTLAAYHAGPGAVERFGGLPPYPSTRRYVARVLALYEAHLAQLMFEPAES